MLISRNRAAALASAAKNHLPGPPDPSGCPVTQLDQACGRHLDDPDAPHPYAELDRLEATEVSQLLQQVTRRVAAETTIGQLEKATRAVASETLTEVDRLEDEQAQLRGDYRGAALKTVAWMGATAGALILGGLLPNPVTGLILAGAAGMTIRSLGQARTHHKELSTRLPELQQNLRVSQQLASDSVYFAPHLQGWNELLQENALAA